MKVDVLASTAIRAGVLIDAYDYEVWGARGVAEDVTDADALGEASGRICYLSFGRPNPATATNAGYLSHIIGQGHYSVMEHASVTFLVRGVSRALLTELTRHRHLSFSVVSQRYVDHADTEPVIPPALRDDDDAVADLKADYRRALVAYEETYEYLRAAGLKRKEAREAARSVLPNAAPVDMVVTGNLRAWRDVLGKRWHVAADAEIREFAGMVLDRLRDVAPNSVQDVPESPYA
ncbi:ThyX-like thymidylate synthase [Streptomyces phage TG1]|uniref:ThyX-like thymidylate synthase n=1 Tax=Streptomyces phage TG1 TaxID=2927987 RepID=K4I0D2_9CAUD|nr:thymidylate synthase [Streptomyces phage TG1]AFU62232.1 ThyX-like thymidylate synthase [Streptomyces phage TG1]